MAIMASERYPAVLAYLSSLCEGSEVPSNGQETTQLYMLVDASRQPMMIPAVLQSMASRSSCLYSGRALQEFGDNAAWVAELLPGETALEWVVENGFNERWTTFVRSPLPLDALVRHLKKFTVIQNPEGEEVFFRFYDPKIMHQYAPVLHRKEKPAFFSQVDLVLFEGDAGGRDELFACGVEENGRLGSRRVV